MTRGLNGETVFSREDVPVGYVDGAPWGYKRPLQVTISVNMEALDRRDTYETTDHRQVRRPLDFSITYGIWRPGKGDMTECGAGVAEALDQPFTSYAPGWDARKVAELRDLAAYHLSAMQAGCDHQEPVYFTDGIYGRKVDLDNILPCPVTGYKYGHAWLVRELPAGFEARVRALFGE